jgi:hypothetical protein
VIDIDVPLEAEDLTVALRRDFLKQGRAVVALPYGTPSHGKARRGGPRSQRVSGLTRPA